MGINITCASGDNGSGDGYSGLHVDFPASSPNVIACGGTNLLYNSHDKTINETVWSGTGGGMSSIFPLPEYENIPSVVKYGKNRVLPDIATNSDSKTGYMVLSNGKTFKVGGTSCSAPLIASYLALVNINKLPNKFLNYTIYKNPSAFNLIKSGSNGFYHANTDGSYCPCTGLGSINGTKLNVIL